MRHTTTQSPVRNLAIILMPLVVLLALDITPHFTLLHSAHYTSQAAIQNNYASLPLAFEPNMGQSEGNAQYLVHHSNATTYFEGATTRTAVGDSQITMTLDGAADQSFTSSDQLESKTNYFLGNDQSKWRQNVPNYGQLYAADVYPGIDLKYYGTNSQLEHDFIVKPGSDYKHIAFHFAGQNTLSLDTDGNLVLTADGADLTLHAPLTYQQTSNSKHTIPSQFNLNGDTVTIAVNGEYNASQPLIIDPTLTLSYSTYLGGSSNDNGLAIRVDASGNAYVAGFTASSNFPTQSPYQASYGGGTSDAFVAKLNITGTGLIYATYLGGSALDYATNLTLDASGNVYAIGRTGSSNYPTSSPYQASYGGGTSDAFITKLNASGSLTYSTFIGGSTEDTPYGIAIDTSGNMYISGFTDSTNFPTTGGSYQPSNAGGQDGFAAELNAAGSSLVYSTYVGGTGNDVLTGVALDTSGNAYLPGTSTSSDYPTVSPYQATNANPGSADAVATKLNPSGSALVYSTYLGGTGTDYPNHQEMALDTSGNLYMSGYTDSTDFPVTGGAYQTANAGGSDAFVTKLAPSGSSLVYSTYLGGTGSDIPGGLDVTSTGDVYIVGQTSSTDFPTNDPLQVSNAGGAEDMFATRLNAAGSAITFSTYLGGTGADHAFGIVVSASGDLYIAGQSNSTNFPTKLPFQASNAGAYDGIVLKISTGTVTLTGEVTPSLSFSISSITCDMGVFSATQTQYCTHTMSAATNATNGYTISYIPTTTLTSGANTITAMASQTASVVASEQFGMNLKANTSAGSFTAANFGADPSGGSGTALTGYNIADQFKFAVGGANIAQATTLTATTTYTASFIANITTASEAGTYSTPVTYNIVASY